MAKKLEPGKVVRRLGGAGKRRAGRMIIYAYLPKLCGDNIQQASGFDPEACRRPIGAIHFVVDGVHALCRSCMVKSLTKEIKDGIHPHDKRYLKFQGGQ